MRAGLSLFVASTLIFALITMVIHAVGSPLGVWPNKARAKIAAHEYDAIVDVRTDMEWATGHYPLAVHIPLARVKDDLPRVFTDKRIRILFYCNTATRARWAAEAAKEAGFVNVEYLIGPSYLL